MLETQPRTFRWDVDDYYKLGDAGWFDGKRVELIEGEIIEMSPINSLHWTAVNLATALFHRLLGQDFIISTQSSIRLSQVSQPEPDIALIAGDLSDYKEALPTVKYWVRNLEKRPESFSLQTATDRFYPDFIVLLEDDTVLAVEYKGAHLLTGDDTKEKIDVGALWAAQSKGMCKFLLVSKDDYQARLRSVAE